MILKIHITLFLSLLYNLFVTKKEIYFIAYLFIIMHELSHMIVALLLKVDITEITLLPFGATAKYVGTVTKAKELAIALAGPLASLLFAYLYGNGVYQSVNLLICFFNLIPIYPMDGGRILRVILLWIFPKEMGMKINTFFNGFFIVLLNFLAIYACLAWKNVSLLLLSIYVSKIFMDETKKEKMRNIINYLQMNE